MGESKSMRGESPSNLEELTAARFTNPIWLADLAMPEIAGGQLRVADLDRITLRPDATALRVSGLDQTTFEALVDRCGRQFKALHFWKCPRIQDFSPLESLPDLTHVAIYWNQRTSRLWNLAKTPALKGLAFEDFSRLRDLEDLRSAVAVEELRFGDAVWVKATVASLEPVGTVGTLRRLSFSVRKIEDGRIQPLAELRLLKRLECPTSLFTTAQLAWLRAHVEHTVEGRVLAPIERFDKPMENPNGSGPDLDVLVMGKRKPFLNSHADNVRLQRYVEDYWKLVDRFRNDPLLEPAST